jgi:hypothetical protein
MPPSVAMIEHVVVWCTVRMKCLQVVIYAQDKKKLHESTPDNSEAHLQEEL